MPPLYRNDQRGWLDTATLALVETPYIVKAITWIEERFDPSEIFHADPSIVQTLHESAEALRKKIAEDDPTLADHADLASDFMRSTRSYHVDLCALLFYKDALAVRRKISIESETVALALQQRERSTIH